MIPYLLLICLPFVVNLIIKNSFIEKKKKEYAITLFFLFLLVLLAVRDWNIGNDTNGYREHYEAVKNIGWSAVFKIDLNWEYGYVVIQKLFSGLSIRFRGFLLIVSAASLYPIWRFYEKESKIPILTVALFVAVAPFSMYFSGLRQVIAMAFAIPAFYFSKDKKFVWFILTVLSAFLFHSSAIVLIAMYPICNVNIPPQRVWIVIPIIGVIWVFNEQIFSFLLEIVKDLYVGEIEKTGAYTILILLIVFSVYSFLIPEECELDNTTKALRNLLLFSVCLQCFASINPLAMRLNYYYLVFIPVLIPQIAKKSKVELKQITDGSVVIMSIFFILYFYSNLLNGSGLGIYPYRAFWS